LSDEVNWPEVVFGGNQRIRAPVVRFRFRPDGTLCFRGRLPYGVGSREEAAEMEQQQALQMKTRMAKAGFASMDDCMFWSLEVLRRYPELGAAIASRFEELLVDEAQDTSELQLACLQEVTATGGLPSLVLIGDLEQSIYSFQGASPDLCQQLADARNLAPADLSQNHRSSQKICDAAVHFCSRDAPDVAVGADASCDWNPELALYPPDEPQMAMRSFRERIRSLGIEETDAAVLARGNALVDEINGTGSVLADRRPMALGKAAWCVQTGGTLSRRQVDRVEHLLALIAWNKDPVQMDLPARRQLRLATMRVLEALPLVRGAGLREWIKEAAQVVGEAATELVETPERKAGLMIRSKASQAGVEASSAFADEGLGLKAQTVHDVKGESRDAVLVVADRIRSRQQEPQVTLWSRPLLGGESLAPEEAEELRIVFVALTRARRFCQVALPSDTDSATQESFLGAGFVRSSNTSPQH
jgi:superfamily I DNA/RNA helicase